MVFPVVMYGCESFHHTEGWALKNWCFWTVVLEKTLESPLNSKEIKQVNPKGNQSCIFIGRTDAEVETLIPRPPDAKSRLIRKDPDAGKDWRQKKGTTEDEMVGWHHWLDGHVWASSWSWWCTRESGMLQFMESHRFGHDWATEQQQQQKCWSGHPSPWTEGPGGLQSIGSQRLRDKWSNWHFTLQLKILDLGFQGKLENICALYLLFKVILLYSTGNYI